ncbi:MAG: hypothetical protein KKH94_10245, partial [Candidatus Omnitrophica bacterium]|nr:hypothetical protein [Candidatus Omnitrophota bacterium]
MPSLERFVRPIMEIRRGEWSKTILMALYFYLTITAYYVLKPARNSLYINYLGANRIPDAILLIAVISYFVVLVYTHYSKKIEHNKIVTGFLLISIGCLLFFRWAFQLQSHAHAPLISFLFFIWVTLFSSIIVMQFWVLANDVFDSQAAKRLYGFVGSGGIWGGITGGFIAMQAKQLHTENLLLVACGYIGLMIVIYNIIWHREEHNFVTRGMEKRIEDGYTQRQLFSFFKQSKYLLLVL